MMQLKAKFLPKLSHRIAAAITVGFMFGYTEAQAADFQAVTTSITTASDNFITLMNLLGYVGGAGLAILGVLKLKEHVDRPDQIPLGSGLMRLATGGLLLSLPVLVRTVQGSINSAGDDTTVMIAPITTFSTAGSP